MSKELSTIDWILQGGDISGDCNSIFSKGCAPCRRPLGTTSWPRHGGMCSAAGPAGCWNLGWFAGFWLSAISETDHGGYFYTLLHFLSGRHDASIFQSGEAVHPGEPQERQEGHAGTDIGFSSIWIKNSGSHFETLLGLENISLIFVQSSFLRHFVNKLWTRIRDPWDSQNMVFGLSCKKKRSCRSDWFGDDLGMGFLVVFSGHRG